jgi:hypothetical protein
METCSNHRENFWKWSWLLLTFTREGNPFCLSVALGRGNVSVPDSSMDVWSLDRHSTVDFHGTQKPVASTVGLPLHPVKRRKMLNQKWVLIAGSTKVLLHFLFHGLPSSPIPSFCQKWWMLLPRHIPMFLARNRQGIHLRPSPLRVGNLHNRSLMSRGS